MKILLFKTGDKIKIDDKIAEKINQNIMSASGAKQWQTFTEASNGEVILLLNLSEVSGIYAADNVM